jgi:CO dehydrogenase/acetyl-CoA synthase beta subunit
MTAPMEDFRRIVEQAKLENKEYSIWHVPAEAPASSAGLPMRVGPGAWGGVLPEDEVQLHFGNHETPSTALLLTAPDSSAVHDGQITLVGRDIPSLAAGPVPFALVVVVWGANLTPDRVKELRRGLQVIDQIEGFVQRSTLQEIRFTLSKVLFEKGVSFHHLGHAFIHLYRTQFPGFVQATEVVFLTANPGSITALKRITQTIRSDMASSWRARLAQKNKAREDCEFEWECVECEYQRVCEELRDIIRLRTDLTRESETSK